MIRRLVRFNGKFGHYIGLVKHTKRYDGHQLAVVKFLKSKRISRVPYSKIRFFTDDELEEMIIKSIENPT